MSSNFEKDVPESAPMNVLPLVKTAALVSVPYYGSTCVIVAALF